MSGVLSFCLSLDSSDLLKSAGEAQRAMAELTVQANAMCGGLLADFARVHVALGGMDAKSNGLAAYVRNVFDTQIKALTEAGIPIKIIPDFSAVCDAALAQFPSLKPGLALPGKADSAGPDGKDQPKHQPKHQPPVDQVQAVLPFDSAFPTVQMGRIFDYINAQTNGRLAANLSRYPGFGGPNSLPFSGHDDATAPAKQAPAAHLPGGHSGAYQTPPLSESSLDQVRLVLNSGGHQAGDSHLAQAMVGTNKSVAALTALVAQQTAILRQIADGVRQSHLNQE